MTNNEKVRIVAEWCGWCPGRVEHIPAEHWINDVWKCNSCGKKRSHSGLCDPRTRLRTLDACAEFERVADKQGLLFQYMNALFKEFFGGDSIRGAPWTMIAGAALFATPAQRVEAILKVIKGEGIEVDE